jgi:hypothetical protein
MSRTLIRIAAAAAGSLLLAHGALATQATEVPRITNGGTGFIGVTESANTGWRPASADRMAALPAGEASTWVNGRPNANPEAPMAGSRAPDTRAMGASADPRANAARNPSWGTPD